MSSNEVVVYTSSGCPYCEKVKDLLDEWGITYEIKNVSIHKEYFDELRANKVFGTPATYVNGKLILGFQEKKFRNAFGMDEREVTTTEQLEETKSKEDDFFEIVNEDILKTVYDVVTIGGGAAGSACALYAARGKLSTLVIDKGHKAGNLALTQKVANYPGVNENVTGLQLLKRMQCQGKEFGAKFVRSTVLSVDFSNEIKVIVVPEGIIKAKAVFIAVGSKVSSNKLVGEREFVGRGVSYCTTCDAAFYENMIVVVVGNSEEAISEAITLSKFCKEVRLIVPSEHNRKEVDLDILEGMSSVHIYKNYHMKEIKGTDAVEKVIVVNELGEELEWKVDGVFLSPEEMSPVTEFLKNAVALDDNGYIVVDGYLKTNVQGIYAGGDVRRTPFRQAVICAADGAIAALAIEQYINKRSALKIKK